jgi:hypothetical protein
MATSHKQMMVSKRLILTLRADTLKTKIRVKSCTRGFKAEAGEALGGGMLAWHAPAPKKRILTGTETGTLESVDFNRT